MNFGCKSMGARTVAVALALCVVAGAASALDVADVKNLLQNKVSDEVIINMVKADGTIYITPEEANMFRSMGASENLITALRPRAYSTGQLAPAAAPVPAPAPASAPRLPTVITSGPPAPAAPAPATVVQAAPPAVVQAAPQVTSVVSADGTPIVPVEITTTSAFPPRFDKEGWVSIFNRDWTTYYLAIDVNKERMFLSKFPNGGMAIESGQNVVINLRKHDYKLYGDTGEDLKVKVREGETTTLSLNPFGVFGNSGLTGVATDRERTRSEILFSGYVAAPPMVVVEQPSVVVERPPVVVVPPPRPYYRPYYYGGPPYRYYNRGGGGAFYFNFD